MNRIVLGSILSMVLGTALAVEPVLLNGKVDISTAESGSSESVAGSICYGTPNSRTTEGVTYSDQVVYEANCSYLNNSSRAQQREALAKSRGETIRDAKGMVRAGPMGGRGGGRR